MEGVCDCLLFLHRLHATSMQLPRPTMSSRIPSWTVTKIMASWKEREGQSEPGSVEGSFEIFANDCGCVVNGSSLMSIISVHQDD